MDVTLGRATNAATAATAGHAVAQLWNPHATLDLYVSQIGLSVTAATACIPALRRSSARGTAGASTTSARENDHAYGAAPASGAIVDVAAFSVQPTLIGSNEAHQAQVAAAIGSGWVFSIGRPIVVPAGTGLVIVTSTAVAFPISRLWFTWAE